MRKFHVKRRARTKSLTLEFALKLPIKLCLASGMKGQHNIRKNLFYECQTRTAISTMKSLYNLSKIMPYIMCIKLEEITYNLGLSVHDLDLENGITMVMACNPLRIQQNMVPPSLLVLWQ